VRAETRSPAAGLGSAASHHTDLSPRVPRTMARPRPASAAGRPAISSTATIKGSVKARVRMAGSQCRATIKLRLALSRYRLGAAAKVVRDLSAVFTFAVRHELLPINPCSAVKKPADGTRTRFLTLEVVARLGETLVTMESEGISPKVIAIARLWVLTGCRRNEIAALQRIEVDFERGCFRLVDTKTGRSVRPLAASARAILQATPRDPQSPYVFPCDDCPSFYQGTKRAGVTPQTLRHTLGSAAVSSGETLAMTGALLGHEDARSTSIYAHMQQDPARRAADRVVGPIATALGGGLASETTARTVQKQLIDPAS
jgi:integrase